MSRFSTKSFPARLRGHLVLAIALAFGATGSLSAAGTHAEGWVVIQLTKFESSGILFDSYEGTATVTSYDPDENCNADENECYKPKQEAIAISVRPESKEAVNFMLKNIGRKMLIQYCIHRIEPVALKTDFEVLRAQPLSSAAPADLADKHVVKKSGARRNFSTRAKILKLEEVGTAVKTYEGLYFDVQRKTVVPFSITNESMAAYAFRVMQTGKAYNLGISQAYVTGFRKSDFDIFEINKNAPAGTLSNEAPAEAAPAPAAPADSDDDGY